MTDLSSTQEQTVLDNIISGGVYVSLHTADEGNEPDGANEVSASDYARASVAATDLSTSGSGPTTMTNDVDINFGTTENDWGTITHAALWDDTAANSGSPYTATISVGNSGDAPSGVEVSIPAGDLTFDID